MPAKKVLNNKAKVAQALDDQELNEENLRTGEKKRQKLNRVAAVEKQAEKDADIVVGAGDSQIEANDQTLEAAMVQGGTGTESEVPAEISAIRDEKIEKKKIIRELEKTRKEKKTDGGSKKVKTSKRSKKYGHIIAGHDRSKALIVAEAVEKLKTLSYAKFDATVELHVSLKAKKKSDELNVRGTINLPSGSPKKRNVVIASDALIEQIEKGKIDFDILLATPEMMPKLAKVAKVLGPKGKMPSPKSGTVTTDPEKTKQELSGGMVEYKTDSHGNVHVAVGKVSWENDKIAKNVETILSVLPKRNIANAVISSTMSPAIKLVID